MTFRQEAASWWSPERLKTEPVPGVGASAPSTDLLHFPRLDHKATVITFLRHCGCPFAEKTFRSFRAAAKAHPNITFVAVSHSTQESTDKWLSAVGGGESVKVLVDDQRQTYAKWGLGVSSFWHILSPWALWSVYETGKQDGIYNRPTESGNRWQTAGSFAVDSSGTVQWSKKASTADEIADFEEGVSAAT